MRLLVVDAITDPGAPSRPNEDAYGMTERHAWVLDGATASNSGPTIAGNFASNAEWLTTTASSLLKQDLSAGVELREALDRVIAQLRREFLAEVGETAKPPVAAGALVSVASGTGLDLCLFGDCAALVLSASGKAALYQIDDGSREAELEEATRFIATADLTFTLTQRLQNPDLARAKSLRLANQNKSGGAWLLGILPEAAQYFEWQTINVAKGDTVLLMTDGFLSAALDYGAIPIEQLIAHAELHGLGSIVKVIRDIENSDREIRAFPRHKISDDATAVLLKIE